MQRRSLSIVAALALGLTALAGVAPASAAGGQHGPHGSPAEVPPGGAAYVAIGDSEAAGTGNQPYVDRDCLRSAKAYPELLAAGFDSFASSACSGASTQAVMATQLGDLGPATQLVTITAGINNLDWQGLLVACSADGDPQACAAAQQAAAVAIPGLPSEIGMLVGAVRTHAPNAQILVTGYPMLFGEVTGSCSVGAYHGTPVRFTADQTQQVNVGISAVNFVIAFGVSGYQQQTGDPGVSFVDVAPAFDGHGLCDSGDRWISGLVNGPVMFPRSFHPNTPGQQAYASAVAAAIAG